jgi:hypothetical protein
MFSVRLTEEQVQSLMLQGKVGGGKGKNGLNGKGKGKGMATKFLTPQAPIGAAPTFKGKGKGKGKGILMGKGKGHTKDKGKCKGKGKVVVQKPPLLKSTLKINACPPVPAAGRLMPVTLKDGKLTLPSLKERLEEGTTVIKSPESSDVPKPSLPLATSKVKKYWRGAAAQYKAMKEALDKENAIKDAPPEETENQQFLKKRLEMTLLGLKAEVALEDIIKQGQELKDIAAQKAASSAEVEPSFSSDEMQVLHKRLKKLKSISPAAKANALKKGNGKGKGHSRKGKKERASAKGKAGKAPIVTSPFDLKPMEVASESTEETSDESDVELDVAARNQFLTILGKARSLMKKEDPKFVGDLKDHLEECSNLIKGILKGKKK